MFLHICFCIFPKEKRSWKKRRKEHIKDEKKTIVLIEGGVQIGVCVWMCVHACVAHHCAQITGHKTNWK